MVNFCRARPESRWRGLQAGGSLTWTLLKQGSVRAAGFDPRSDALRAEEAEGFFQRSLEPKCWRILPELGEKWASRSTHPARTFGELSALEAYYAGVDADAQMLDRPARAGREPIAT